MPDYRTIDWTQAPPDSPQLERDWLGSQVLDISKSDPRLDAVVESLKRTNNGGAQVAQFRLEVLPAVRWFLTRNRLPEAGFFRKFFCHEVVQRRLVAPLWIESAVRKPSSSSWHDDFGFSLESPFVAMGRLAHTVSNGGAYLRFEGSDAEVLRLTNGFTEAAFENRYSETRAYLSWEPWSSWFKGVAWDASFFWLDLRTGTATVLLVTDTD